MHKETLRRLSLLGFLVLGQAWLKMAASQDYLNPPAAEAQTDPELCLDDLTLPRGVEKVEHPLSQMIPTAIIDFDAIELGMESRIIGEGAGEWTMARHTIARGKNFWYQEGASPQYWPKGESVDSGYFINVTDSCVQFGLPLNGVSIVRLITSTHQYELLTFSYWGMTYWFTWNGHAPAGGGNIGTLSQMLGTKEFLMEVAAPDDLQRVEYLQVANLNGSEVSDGHQLDWVNSHPFRTYFPFLANELLAPDVVDLPTQ